MEDDLLLDDGHAEIEDTTREECMDKWEGVDWTAYEDGSERGRCKSNFDFDAWAEKYEGGSNESNC